MAFIFPMMIKESMNNRTGRTSTMENAMISRCLNVMGYLNVEVVYWFVLVSAFLGIVFLYLLLAFGFCFISD